MRELILLEPDRLEDEISTVIDAARPPHVSESDQPHAYASESLKCARAIAYRVADVDKEGVLDLRSRMSFDLGNYLHGLTQRAFRQLYPDSFRDEVRWDKGTVTGRADGHYLTQSVGTVVLEIKTMNPWTFVDADEPDPAHEMQAALSALVFAAPRTHIVYINKAARWGKQALKQWLITPDLAAATVELGRLDGIVRGVASGVLPDRVSPTQTFNPKKGRAFPCAFCSYRLRCLADGPGVGTLPDGVGVQPKGVAALPDGAGLQTVVASPLPASRASPAPRLPRVAPF